MLGDISGLDRIYIVCGYTDMRKSIDGLCAIIEDQLKASLDSVQAAEAWKLSSRELVREMEKAE